MEKRFGKLELLVLVTIGLVSASLAAPNQAKPSPAQNKPAHIDFAEIKTTGVKSAPIKIEIFSDFQCPLCRQIYLTVTKPMIEEYVSKGKVYLIHHDFPLTMHAHSRDAAKWANAGAAIGKFQEVETALYTKQDVWGTSGNIESVLSEALSPAEMKRMRQALVNPEIDASIQRDMDLAKSLSVTSTPTIYFTIKGQAPFTVPAPGLNYSLLKQYLDYLLKQ